MAKKPASKTVKKAAPAKKAVAKAETKVAKPATPKKAASKPVAPAKKVAVKSTAKVAPQPAKKAAPVKKAEVKPVKKAEVKVAPAKKAVPAKKVVAKVEAKATKAVKTVVKPTPAKKAAVQEVAPVKKVTKTAAKIVAPPEPKPEKKSVKPTPPPVVAAATKKVAPVAPVKPKVEPEKIVHKTNMKKSYSKAELEEFKEVINQKREEILKQLESLSQIMRDTETGQYINENSPYSLHMAEQGTDAMEREKTFLYAQRETKFLGYLEEALKRIDAGTYGVCVECMDTPQNLCPTCPLIPKERLFAVPHSQHCLPIKQRQEKKKNY